VLGRVDGLGRLARVGQPAGLQEGLGHAHDASPSPPRPDNRHEVPARSTSEALRSLPPTSVRRGVPRSADRLRWMIMIRPDRDFSPDPRDP
jgi:hypothetical protein